ncbi:N-acetylneuraminate synthase family protein [bacterium]|nr:N-acetylneuraminate synthase family protein [bacterium]
MVRCKVIAEIGVNHDGDWQKALDLVDAAQASGADYAKFQIFNSETCKGEYRDILRPLQLSYDAHRAIKAHCDEIGIRYLASCFDRAAVDFVISLGCHTVKIGSGEMTNGDLIKYVAEKQLALILSTGMATADEVSEAVNKYLWSGGKELTLLHCVSNYPTKLEHCNMMVLAWMKNTFRWPVGFSDHTLGWISTVPAAMALGATVLEKHLTYSSKAEGPDHHMSLEPFDFSEFVRCVRKTEVMLGDGIKRLQPGEAEMQKVARGRWNSD